jgi:3-oxoacyl-[acyl-carrier protein] reductase
MTHASAFSGRFAGRAAIAMRLAAEGARVSLWDVDAAALSVAREGAAAVDARALDITDAAAVERAMEESVTALGGLDVLVACAGITGPNGPVRDYPLEAWRRVIEVNLTGTFLCNRAAVPSMERGGYGRIVNIASIAGKEGNPNVSAYSASKAGVIALTKSLGKELAGTSIRVNCVTPAAVRTAIFDQMTPQHIEFMLSKIPLARFGLIEEIASIACWLASEECSFSTGAVFDASGGRATY